MSLKKYKPLVSHQHTDAHNQPYMHIYKIFIVRIPKVSGAFFSAGIAMFSGSCYAVGITEDRSNGKLAPIGGISLMCGWISLALMRK